jgi:hypothetical protein
LLQCKCVVTTKEKIYGPVKLAVHYMARKITLILGLDYPFETS